MLEPRTLYFKFDYKIDPIDIVESVLEYISTNDNKIENFIRPNYKDQFKEDFSVNNKKETIANLVTHLTTILTNKLVKLVAEYDKNIFFVNTKDNHEN